jgi:hypothetical protein
MAEVLQTDFFTAFCHTISIEIKQVEAVELELVFTPFVGTLLGVVSVAAMILLYLGHRCHASGLLVVDPSEHWNLHSFYSD